jgi:hypothetical protein
VSDPAWYDLRWVTPFSLFVVCILASAFIGSCFVALGRDGWRAHAWPEAAPADMRWAPALWLAALFLVVVGAKLLLISANPAPVPYWDQWDAEADRLYIPFNAGSLSWGQMFGLHNEHRIFFTRLEALALLVVNRVWDPHLQMVINAALHALVACVLAAALWLAGGKRHLDVIVAVCAVLFAMPFSSENTLAGFQSAFYFLLLFAITAHALMTLAPVGAAGWWLGCACALASLFTVAGGAFVAPALSALVLLRWWSTRSAWRPTVLTVAVLALVFAVALLLTPRAAEGHGAFRAQSASEFIVALGRYLAWPMEQPYLAVVMWLPWIALAFKVLHHRKANPIEQLMLSLGLWVGLQAVAMAYARGTGGTGPASRYMDVLSIGTVLNVLSLIHLRDLAPRTGRVRALLAVTSAAWIIAAAIGVDRFTSAGLDIARDRAVRQTRFVANIQQFLATGDMSVLGTGLPTETPHPIPANLAKWLRHPFIQSILPAAVRRPMLLTPGAITNEAFVPAGVFRTTPLDPLRPSFGSYTSLGNGAVGRFESEPITCEFRGRLLFEVAGYLGAPGTFLGLRELASGRQISIELNGFAREAWVPVHVSCPAGPFTVIAIDDAPTPPGWFAFRGPVLMGTLSDFSGHLINRARLVLILGVCVAAFIARRDRSDPASAPK